MKTWIKAGREDHLDLEIIDAIVLHAWKGIIHVMRYDDDHDVPFWLSSYMNSASPRTRVSELMLKGCEKCFGAGYHIPNTTVLQPSFLRTSLDHTCH